MAGKSRTHSEGWWETAPPFVLRRNGRYKGTGEQCRRVAEDGSVVCDQHGGAAAQVRKRAAERILFTADEAAAKLVEWMNDETVDKRERVKIAQDLLDRNGIVSAQVHKILPITDDPVEALFKSIVEDPEGLMDVEPLPALGSDEDEDYGDLIGLVVENVETTPLRPERTTPLAVAPGKPTRSPLIPPRHIREGLAKPDLQR